MHFKDFTDQFYQYPHHLSYSQLIRNHHDSFATFIEDVENTKGTQMVSRSRSTKKRFNGKMLKNIFTQLKNKTSAELEEFIDLSALNPSTPATSGFSAQENSTSHKAEYETYNLSVSNGVVLSKSTQAEERRKWRTDDDTVNHPEVQISVDSQEFEHIEKSIRFVVCPKKRLGNIPADDTVKKIRLNGDAAPTSSILKIKNVPELNEGRVVEVYNVLKKVISNVKWKYKKCRSNNPQHTLNRTDTPTETTTTYPNKMEGSSYPRHDYGNCNCGKMNSQKQQANCDCWSKEDETLFCLLKLETRENFKQIRHIEQELRLQRKALKFLNNRYKSLEDLVNSKGIKTENKFGKNYSETGVQEIFVKGDKQNHENTIRKKKLDDNLQNEDTFSHIPVVEKDDPKSQGSDSVALSSSEDTEEDSAKNSKIGNEDKHPNAANPAIKEISDVKTSEDIKINDSPNQKTEVRELVVKSQSGSQSILGSKIKITISRSTVVINTTNDDPTNIKTVNQKYEDTSSCHCSPDLNKDDKDCECPTKKPSFVFKFFRKQSCDSKCKCCTTTKTNKKRCKYFMEKKNKSKNNPSSEIR